MWTLKSELGTPPTPKGNETDTGTKKAEMKTSFPNNVTTAIC